MIAASSKQPCTNLTQYSCKIGGVRFECTCQPRRAITAGIVFLCTYVRVVELFFQGQPTIVIVNYPRLMRRSCIAGLAFVMILLLVLCWNRTDYKKPVENNVRFAMQCKRLWIVTLICESAALVCELSDAPRHVRCQWDRQHADWLCSPELR